MECNAIGRTADWGLQWLVCEISTMMNSAPEGRRIRTARGRVIQRMGVGDQLEDFRSRLEMVDLLGLPTALSLEL